MDNGREGLPLRGAAEVAPMPDEAIRKALAALVKGRTGEALAYMEGRLDDPFHSEIAGYFESLCEQVDDMNRYALEIARGNLRAQSPGPANRLANGLKALQNALLHMIWQAKQVAGGDYSQRVEYLGELSDVFNIMIGQLAERELALRTEIEKHREMESALKQSYELLLSATDAAGQSVYFVDCATGSATFYSESAKNAERDCAKVNGDYYSFIDQVVASGMREGIQEIQCEGCGRWFSISAKPGLQMNERSIDVYIANDITDRRNNEMRLRDQAICDPLTGLVNRRAGRELIMDLLRTDQAFTVVFIDLNDFKSVNDNYGHAQGDYVLKAFADTTREVLRQEDTLCRYAGDEFIAILPSCSRYKAAEVMKRVRERFLAREDTYGIDFSTGYAEHMQGDATSLDSLIDDADREMYRDKDDQKSGRVRMDRDE